GDFVRRWLPALAHVPAPFIHKPWTMTPLEQRQAGCVLGQDYPAPIVDHAAARERTLAAYQRAG
ncbi:MAG: FAD-binding domain-containing protein, partial [Anaerolineae bacterium]